MSKGVDLGPDMLVRFSILVGTVLLHAPYTAPRSERADDLPTHRSSPDCANAKDPPIAREPQGQGPRGTLSVAPARPITSDIPSVPAP